MSPNSISNRDLKYEKLTKICSQVQANYSRWCRSHVSLRRLNSKEITAEELLGFLTLCGYMTIINKHWLELSRDSAVRYLNDILIKEIEFLDKYPKDWITESFDTLERSPRFFTNSILVKPEVPYLDCIPVKGEKDTFLGNCPFLSDKPSKKFYDAFNPIFDFAAMDSGVIAVDPDVIIMFWFNLLDY